MNPKFFLALSVMLLSILGMMASIAVTAWVLVFLSAPTWVWILWVSGTLCSVISAISMPILKQ